MKSKLKTPLILISLAAILFTIFYFIGSPYIFSDGYGYYHVGKTLVTEGNFVTSNQPDYYPYTGHAVMQFEDHYTTVYSPGNAILWWPFLTVGKIFNSGTVYTEYHQAFNGHHISDGVLIAIASIFYSVLAIYFIYKILKMLGFRTKISIFAIASLWLSSYILGYILINSSFSHSYEVFTLCGLLYTFLKGVKDKNNKYLILSGLFGGLNVLIRPFNLIILIPFVLYLIYKKDFKKLIFFITGGVVPALILFLYNYNSYGAIFTTGYQELWGVGLSLSQFNFFKLLFSTVRGWFIYTPVALISIIALLKYSFKDVKKTLLFVIPIFLTIFIYSFWENWWAGDSIGQRFFIVLIPFACIGLAYLLQNIKYKYRSLLIILLAICTIYSLTTLLLYRFTPTAVLATNNLETSEIYPEVTAAERFTPIDIYRYHFGLINKSSSLSDYYNNLKNGLNGGRSLFMIDLGLTDPLVKIEKITDNKFNLNIIPNTTSKDISANIKLDIDHKGSKASYELQNINTSTLLSIQAKCLESCEVNYSDKILIEDTNIENFDWIDISENIKISLSSDSDINFVDYKLKY